MELPPLSKEPLISVLVSCYNCAKFIGQCIETVLQQSYPRFELIISDDASTDRSIDEIQRWVTADRRVRLVARRHRGMAGALNAAWELSSGEIVCLLDGDDTFLPGKLRAVLEAFQSNPHVGYLIHRTCRTDADGKRYGVMPLLKSGPSGWRASQTLAGGGVLADVPPTSNLSFRREVLQRVFPLPETLHGFAELVIQRLAPLLTNILSLDQALATWRLHDANDMNMPRLLNHPFDREIEIMETVWGIQRQFLGGIAPDAALALQPLIRSDYYCRMQYMLAWQRSSPESAAWRRRLLNTLGFKQRPFLDRVLWRFSPALPAAPMNWLLELTMTQNMAKEWIARILRIGK